MDCTEPAIAIFFACQHLLPPSFADPDGVQERVLLLPPHNLRSLLYARHRFMGESHFEYLPIIIRQIFVYIFTGLLLVAIHFTHQILFENIML